MNVCMNEITTVLFLTFANVIIHLKIMAVRGYQARRPRVSK